MRILVIFFYLLLIIRASGQSSYSYYPVQFSQYMRYNQFFNPASIGADSRIGTTLGSRNHVGNFSGISTYFASIIFALKEISRPVKPYNVLGLKIDRDREGKYIGRTRVYAMYAFHFKLSKDYYFSGGVDAGILNISVKGTPSTGDESEFIPDANSGIWLYNESFYFGFSINQLFNGRLQPYQEISVMRRHINITAMKKIELSRIVTIKPSFLIRFPSYLNYNADYTVECFVSDFIGGISIRHKLGSAFWLGMDNINIAKGKLEAVLSYNTPLKRSLININTLEIICKYDL